MYGGPRSLPHAFLIGALGVLIAGSGWACGSPPHAVVTIPLSDRDAFDRVTELEFYFYDSVWTCASLLVTRPRPPALYGPFPIAIRPEELRSERGVVYRDNTIAVGTYTIRVDAVSTSSGAVGSGCIEGQRVKDGETTVVDVRLDPAS